MGRNAGRGGGQSGDVLSLLRDAGSRNHPQGLSRPCGVAGSRVGACGRQLAASLDCWPEHPHVATPCGLGSRTPWRRGPDRAGQKPSPAEDVATKITDPAGLKGRKRRPARAWGASAASRVPGRVCRASEVGVRAPPRTANAPELQTVPSTKASACTRAGGRRRDSLPGDGFPSHDVDRGAAQAVTHSHRLCFPHETLPAGWRIPRRWTPRLASSKSQRHGDFCPQNPQISPAGGAQLARPGMAVNRELIHCVILPP